MHKKFLKFSLPLKLIGLFLVVFFMRPTLMQPINPASMTPPKPKPHVLLIPLKGAIGPASEDFVRRGIKEAQTLSSQAILLKIDTPGGLADSMRGIVQAILASPIPVIGYVAPSGAHAASAGTYILYASHIAAMAPGTNLGAATPVAFGMPQPQNPSPSPAPSNPKPDASQPNSTASLPPQSSEPSSTALKKATNDAKAYIISLAELRGRNVKWAADSVTKADSLSAQSALHQKVIDILANTPSDLLEQADGRYVSVIGKTQQLHTAGLPLRSYLPDKRFKFLSVITNPSIAYILLMVGIYGLFFEFVNPGLILPGMTGTISMLLALYALNLLPINYAGAGLLLFGIILFVAEAFTPSMGLLAIGGLISFIVGSVLLIKTQSTHRLIPLQLIFSLAGVSLLFFLGIAQLALRAQAKKLVSGKAQLIGKYATIINIHGKPWIEVNGERWAIRPTTDNKTTFQPGDTVEVMGIEGLTLIVRAKKGKKTAK